MPTGMWLYAYFALWALLGLETLLLIAVIRQLGYLHAYWVKNDPEWGLPLGALAPALRAEDIFGHPVSLASGRNKNTLLFFVSPGCPSCQAVLERVAVLNEQPEAELILIVNASKVETQLFLAEFFREIPVDLTVVADADDRYLGEYKIVQVPAATVVDVDGRIGAKGSPITFTEVSLLINQAIQIRKRRLKENSAVVTTSASPETQVETANEPVQV